MKISQAILWTATATIGLAVLVLGLIYMPPGYHAYIVRSDSMKPVFAAGDLIVARPPSSNISIGSIAACTNCSDYNFVFPGRKDQAKMKTTQQ